MIKFFFIFVYLALAKQLTTIITLSPSDPWKYLTKYAVAEGKASFKIKAQLIQESQKDFTQISLCIYQDSVWQTVLNEPVCSDKNKTALFHLLNLSNSQNWSQEYSGSLSLDKPEFWFFSISSCEISEMVQVRVEISLNSSSGSEFSAEDLGLEKVYFLFLVIYLAFLLKSMLRIIEVHNRDTQIPFSLFVLNGSILTQFGAIFFKIGSFGIYWYYGRGTFFFDVFGQALEVFSSILVYSLFILIASGWTLRYTEFPESEIYVPVCMLISLIDFILIIIGKLGDDAYYKFSDYEDISGFFIVLLRVMSWVWFFSLARDLGKSISFEMKSFLFKFIICVSTYLLSLPVIVVFSWVLETYYRKFVVLVLVNSLQVGVFCYIFELLSDKSEFYRLTGISSLQFPMKSKKT